MGGFSLELKTFSWEEVHKVEKIEGNQTEEEDKEKAEDESRGADNHVHFDFLRAGVWALTSWRGRIVALTEEELVIVRSCMVDI